jgi:hypothetical protein
VVDMQVAEHHRVDLGEVDVALQRTQRAVAEIDHQ